MKEINIIGVGSLGSYTAFELGKMAPAFGWEFTYIDHDKVAPHNTINQLYRQADIGKYKVDALSRIMWEFTGTRPRTRPVQANKDTSLHGTVIMLVDNMAARKEIFEACAFRIDIDLYIEARSGGTGAQVYALDPRDTDLVKRYRETLYSDDESLPAPCADATTVPIIPLIAGTIGHILVRHDRQRIAQPEMLLVPIDLMDLPSLRTLRYNS
ncbi:MAG: ThiF family adenylyltransferase [bacterium]|nr:ThiF family adenylyltransferase [bacterium]